ncbi:MAG: polyprenyl synthetase family protein [Actinobacteria bacterium]|nr:polyprenyl synthetase family protein [Actinomycetota bacterium]
MRRVAAVETYTPSLDELRNLVEGELDEFLRARAGALPEASPMIEEISALIGAGGKRIRPAFCYWGYRAAGGTHCDAIVRAAASLELLHTFAIVHDDIMDGSDERRGVATVHVRHGVGVGILVGDLALVLADELFMTAGFDAATTLRGFGSYSVMREEVISGQHMDVVAANRIDVSEEHARRIAVLKSGRYSIEKPLVIGAALAGASDGFGEGLSRFGDPLGEAFQMRDDILGTFGDRVSVGKPVDSDIREGKRHVLYAKTRALLGDGDRARFEELWGAADLTTEEVDTLRGLIDSSGARAEIESEIDHRWSEARSVLEETDIPPDARSALEDLGRQAVRRRV